MSKSYVPAKIRTTVAQQARFRCGYCLTQEAVVGTAMEIDHILPEALGGLTEENNLWLACAACNAHKTDRIGALDPVTGIFVRFFDPRHQVWQEHFNWSEQQDFMIGQTPTGRATVLGLQLNRVALVRARRFWILAGWHPPTD